MKKTQKFMFKMIVPILMLTVLFLCNNTDTAYASSTGWKANYYEIKSSDGTTIRFETLTNKGDATLITITKGSSKKYALVDTGIQAANVASTLSKKGIKKINYLILTHNDGDHINGLKNFQKAGIKVNNLYYNFLYSEGNPQNEVYNILQYVKGIKTSVITGSATRIRDAKNHSSTSYNVNMDNSNYLKICRGRLYKLSKSSAENGYDFIIIPPVSDEKALGVNNTSMMVVIQTTTERVVLGGDIQASGMDIINKYKNSADIKYSPDDAYSYYYGIENYLFHSPSDKRYTSYKVSHHGTGSNRHCDASSSIIAVEQTFIKNMLPDALVLTGYNTEKADVAYFQSIFNSAKRYSSFANKGM